MFAHYGADTRVIFDAFEIGKGARWVVEVGEGLELEECVLGIRAIIRRHSR